MSLLNQMLKDLERRDQGATASTPVIAGVRSVASPKRPWRQVVMGSASVGLLAVAAYLYGYHAEDLVEIATHTLAAEPTPEPPEPVPDQTMAATDDAVATEPPPAMEATPALLAPGEATKAAETTAPKAQTASSGQPAHRAPAEPTPAATHAAGRVQKTVTPAQQAQRLHLQALDLLQDGKLDTGMARLAAALALDPERHEVRYQLAALHMQLQQTQAAESLLKAGLQSPEATATLTPLLGRLALEQNDPAQAEVWLQQGLTHNPRDATLHGLMGTALREQRRYEAAATHYLTALRHDPTMPGWLIGIALCWENMGQRDDAREALERAARSGRLSSDLAAFVDTRLLALGSR
jgi:tetratricopeptide (TPR) repeat protein